MTGAGDVLAAIDYALVDATVSPDAMRWTPDPGRSSAPGLREVAQAERWAVASAGAADFERIMGLVRAAIRDGATRPLDRFTLGRAGRGEQA